MAMMRRYDVNIESHDIGDVEVNIAPRLLVQGVWNVEVIDREGAIEQAIFLGPNAEARCRSYALSFYGIR